MKSVKPSVDSVPVLLTEQLKKGALEYGEKTAIYHLEQRISYHQLDHWVDRLGSELIARGVRPGDRVILSLHRKPELIASFLAVFRAGAIAVPLDFRLSVSEAKEFYQLIRPTGAIMHHDIYNQIGTSGAFQWTIIYDSDKPVQPFQMEPFFSGNAACQFPTLSESDPIYLNFTSGSTGRSKAAIATHLTLYANTKACVDVFHLTVSDVHLPLFGVMTHPHENFCRALFTGASVVLVDNLYPRSIAQAIQTFRVTCVMAVPPVYELFLPFLDNNAFDFSSLRLVESGGMATQESLISQFQDKAAVPIIPVWGSTETMGVAFARDLHGKSPAGSVGKALPGYDVRIVSSDGEDLPAGEVGELWLKGSSVMTGYWQDESENQQILSDGWYKTGDLFQCDDNGNFYFRGRKDALIKMGGLKVYPAEIEAVLFSHPLIREAIVMPFNDRLRGWIPLAAVVIEPGETLTESQLRQFLKEKLARYKLPRIIRFLPVLPRTPAGKIDRKALSLTTGSDDHPPDLSLRLRQKAIDLKILHLLNERLKISLELEKISSTTGFQPERFQETIRMLKEFNPGPIHDSIIEELFQRILSIHQFL